MSVILFYHIKGDLSTQPTAIAADSKEVAAPKPKPQPQGVVFLRTQLKLYSPRRVILLRSDIRLTPSYIRFASFGRRIEYHFKATP